MSKEENKINLNSVIDLKEGDRFYFIRIRKNGKKTELQRINHGFNVFELIGILEETKLDLLKQLSKENKPDIIERVCIKELTNE